MKSLLVVLATILVLGFFMSSGKKKKLAKVFRGCEFSVAGQDRWFHNDGSMKAEVRAVLTQKMDDMLYASPTTTGTPQLLVEETFQALKPGCSMAEMERALAEIKEDVPSEMYEKVRWEFDAIYALAAERIAAVS